MKICENEGHPDQSDSFHVVNGGAGFDVVPNCKK